MPDAAARRAHLRALRKEIAPPPRRSFGRLRLLIAVLAGVAVLGGAAAVYRSRAIAYETVALTRGSVEVTYAVDGFVVRREQVYTAPAAGKVQRLVPEGQRVRVGAPVAKIVAADAVATAPAAKPTPAPVQQPTQAAAQQGDSAVRREIDRIAAAIYQKAVAINSAKADGDNDAAGRLQTEMDQLSIRQQELTQQLGKSQPIITPPPPMPVAEQPAGPSLGEITASAAGLVIYQIDGLEGRLAPGQEKEWKPSVLTALSAVPRALGESVAKGDPVLKVVDNLALTLLAVVEESALKHLGDSDRISIRFTGRDGPPVGARITRRVPEGGAVLLVISAPAFPEELVHQRRFRATVLMGAFDGMVAPRTALDVRDGLQGVWVLEGLTPRFHPVRVLGGTDELLALETDLQAGVTILKQAPTWMR